MITDPARYAPAFIQAGSGSITFHIEVVEQPRPLIEQIRGLGARVGVALNPGTPAEAVFNILDQVDLVLVMTVWPGFGGQRFMPECLPKIEALAARLRAEQWLEVDGGVNHDTAVSAVAAGADTLVAGSAIYGNPHPGAAVKALREAALRATKAAAGQRT
jgi:ribulose-phosphate 3-epimerase